MFAMVCALGSCGKDESDDPLVPPTPVNPPDGGTTGDVSITIDTGGSTGSGSSSSPIVVEKGKTLDMVISQKSSYTDPDGSVITREPKANISLKAKLDTLCVKDIKTLTSVNGNPKVESSSSGNSPLRNKTLQTFSVGGQEITFDLGYEIYKIVNSANKTIEMPYIKLNPANYGTATSVEKTDDKTRAAAYVTGITLTPLPKTRSITVTDSTAYNVSVSFNLDLESVNTKEENKQNLSFNVNYIGIVENSTEYPDPETTFSYKFNILGGTNDATSPFNVNKGETLHLEYKQSIKHTYFWLPDLAMKDINFEPTAYVKLSAATDTIWATNAAEFEKVTASEPVVSITTEQTELNTSNQVFEIGEQKISAEWAYEICRGKLPDGAEVALPYLELGKLNLVSVNAVKKGAYEDAEEIGDKTAMVYEITAKFSQDVSSKLAPNEVKQTLEYVVKYIGAIEITLSDVKYRKSYEWYPAHDNLQMASQLIIYRDRTYSNGVTFTDTYQSSLMGVDWMIIAGTPPPYNNTSISIDKEGTLDNGDKVFWHAQYKNYVDTGGVCTYRTRVPNIENYEAVLLSDRWPMGTPGEYAQYNGSSGKYDPANPQEGWYFKEIERRQAYNMKPLHASSFLRRYTLSISYRDRFRYISDNISKKLVDFSEYRMTYDFNFNEERTTTPEGYPARVVKHDCKAKYLGKDFYWAVIDTIYQTTPLK
ncbi:MAG: hypothetical protein J6B00_00455 [Alphaproteobacteria bacterium]|nr:hypothetical protein [Alphaproteobacteria bacterium]